MAYTQIPYVEGDRTFKSTGNLAFAQIPHYKGDRTFKFQDSMTMTIHHGANPAEVLDVMSVVIPADAHFSVPLHYHPRSIEWMRLLEGEVQGVIGGEKRTMRAGDDWVQIPPGTHHSFDKPGGKDGKSVVWLERAGPDPETNLAKKRFFEDFIGNGTPRSFVGALAVFYRDGDSIPVVPGGPYTAWVGHAFVYLLGGLAHFTGLVAPGKHYIGK